MDDGSRLSMQKTYKVVMNSYLSAVSKYEKADPGQSLFITCAEMTIRHLDKQPAVDYKGVKRMTVR